jgi:hypothetical protein
MKKIIFWVIVILLIYHFRNDIPIIRDIVQNDQVSKISSKLVDSIKNKLTEEQALSEMKTWVLKNGISLPKDWVLGEKNIGNQKITVMIPPKPKSDFDFIALNIKRENTINLPEKYCLGEDESKLTCLVGTNSETARVFSILTFVR